METKFKVEYHYSNGFGDTMNHKEWFVDVEQLKNMFNGEIIEYVERWIKGKTFSERIELSDDQILIIGTTTDGDLNVEFQEWYRAGGYDDDPVYRHNSDVYIVKRL